MGPGDEDDEPRGFLEEAFEHSQRGADATAEEPTIGDLDVNPEHPGLAPEPGAAGGSGVDADALDATLQAEPAPPTLTDDERALVDEAMKKSGLIWIDTGLAVGAQAAWYVWANGAAYVLTGGVEQPDAGLSQAPSARVVARSKDTRSRLVEWPGSVSSVSPDDADWDEIAGALAKARLNLTDAATAPARWARDPAMAIYRIEPAGPLVERPGQYSDESRRAQPVPTTAVTAGPPPKVIHRRQTARRPLS